MKKIKYLLFAMSLFVIALTSCSKEEDSKLEKPKQETINKNTGGRTVTTFLNSYYSQNFQFGKSVITADMNMKYAVTEVIVGTEARGYIAVDNASGAFLYFVDVDRTNFIMTTVDIGLNETTRYQQIDNNPNYAPTNGFDFIKVVEDANGSGAPLANGRRFWGWSDWEYSPCVNGWHTGHRTHYVFWMENTHDYDFSPC